MKLHYAVEIFTKTVFTNSSYGISNGVFRFVTDRPNYDLSTVIPKYSADEIDINGSSIGGNDVPYAFCEGFLLKDSFIANPSRAIDIITTGNYATDSRFSFKIRNDIKFWNYCQTNAIYLTGLRIVLWVSIDDVFYQCARGRIINNPYTEVDYTFEVDDDATLIHKNIPPRSPVLSADSVSSTNLSQGDPIPIVFGNAPHSKILKSSNVNDFINLSVSLFGGAKRVAAAVNTYSILTDGTAQITLFNNYNYGYVEHALEGKYLSVVGGKYSGNPVNTDKVYKIIYSSASQHLSIGWCVTLKIASPLVYSTGTGDTDVLISYPDFNNPANGYSLSGVGSSGENTWWFSISNYAVSAWVSNNSVMVSNIYMYDSTMMSYNDVSSLLDFSISGQPQIKLAVNSASKSGSVIQYEKINLSVLEYTWGTGLAKETYNTADDIALITDKLRSTFKAFSHVVTNAGKELTITFQAQETIPSNDNQVLSNSYQAIYLCIDFTLRHNDPVGSPSYIRVGNCYLKATDILGGVFSGTAGTWSDLLYALKVVNGADAQCNTIPNNLITDSSTDGSNLFGKQSNAASKTYRYILKVNDLNPSAFTSHQIPRITLCVSFKTDNAAQWAFFHLKEVAIIGERQIDTLTADLFAKSTGETLSNDGATYINNVYRAFRHILEGYDGIPAALIDYGNLSASRSAWMVSRTLTERKNSADYLGELCTHSFVGMFGGRTGKRVLRPLNIYGTITPTTGNGKTPIHCALLISRNSISGFIKSGTDSVFNYFRLQYAFDAGSNGYLRCFNIANIEQNAFPLITDLDSYGNPLWWSYCSGLQTSSTDPSEGYGASKAIWDICHASYLMNGVAHQAQGDISQLDWYSDSLIYDSTDSSGSGALSSAYQFLTMLAQWATLQKDIVSYSIPINSDTIGTELLDAIQFNDIIYTNGTYRTGWITKVEYDIQNDRINLEAILQPPELVPPVPPTNLRSDRMISPMGAPFVQGKKTI